MKKLTILICMFLAVTTVYARAIKEDYTKAEEQAKVSYAFGMIMGTNLDSMPLEFDYSAFSEGLRSILESGIEPLFSEQEAYDIVETALQRAMEKMSEGNRGIESDFLIANSQRPGVMVTESGLQYEVIKDTKGDKPTIESVVRVKYEGTFVDGSPFDKSEEAEGAMIPLEMVIQGWTEGIMLMSPGSIYKLYIPSDLAYGKDGIQGIIPPYSTLIFNVELLEIMPAD